MNKREKLQKEIRETQLLERLDKSREMIADMCSQRRPPKMRIPAQPIDEDIFIITTLMDAKAELEKRQWIPVSERLPEEDGYYLVRTISTHIYKAHNGVYQTWFYHDNLAGHEFSGDVGVTHWHPLPEPPQEKN